MLILKPLLVALQFLTWMPFRMTRQIKDEEFARSMFYFPVVGLMIGMVLVGSHILCIKFFPQIVVSAVIVVLLVIVTGGLHLDGFADTVDGFYAGRTREEVLQIMKDPHIGAMGAIGLVCLLLTKFALIDGLRAADRYPGLILMPVLSRWAMVISASTTRYARAAGLGKPFMDHLTPPVWLGATVITLITCVYIARVRGILLFAATLMITFGLVSFIKKRIGGMTGDTFGAVGEIVEVFVLMSLYLSAKWV